MPSGQVYTIEPGLYTDEYGCRYSDTVAIAESGAETPTRVPRDIDSNVV